MKRIFYSLVILGIIFAAFMTVSRSSGAQNKDNGEKRISPEAAKQMSALAQEKSSRTAAQKKISSQLLYFLKMERGERIADGVDTLETGLAVDDKGFIEVDIVADVTKKLQRKLKAVKAKIIISLPEYRSITASIPLSSIESLAELDEVYFISPRRKGETLKVSENQPVENPTVGFGNWLTSNSKLSFADRAANVRNFIAANLDGDTPNIGSVTSQGDVTHQANLFRAMTGFNGAGIKIGVMSDGVNSLAARQASGDLPSNVTVLSGQAGSGDEGTAMLEIVYDLAPGAQLYYATASSGLPAFAQNIRNLRAAGCTIIIDDLGYSNESVFQNGQAANVISPNNAGVVVQAVNDVTVGSMAGALYFSSAANSGNKNDATSSTWEGDFVDAGPATGILQGAGNLHNFGNSVINPITQNGGAISLHWSDPLGGSANDYDLFVLNNAGTQVVAAGTDTQSGTQDAIEFIAGSANVAGNSVVITKFSGATRFLHLDGNRNRFGVSTPGSTKGHNAGINTISIAATPTGPAVAGTGGAMGPYPNPFSSVNQVERFSSDGPRRIFYNADGSAITPGNVSATGGQLLAKPDLTAADGNSTAAAANSGFNPFFGTSAAAPHAGALAALVKSACSQATNTQIYNAFSTTAIDIEASGGDRDSGAGIMMPIPAFSSLSSVCGGTPSSVQFSVSSYSVNENAGNAVITVTRTGGTTAASVNYATSNGTATAGVDYQAANGTLNFAANETSKTFNVSIIDDTLVEGNETVNLTLSSPTGATVGTPATAVLNIIDDDVNCTYQLNPTSNSVAAGGGGGSFQVITPAGCPWSTTVSAPFAPEIGDNFQSAPETVFTNSNSININDRSANTAPPGLGSLYPSNIAVSGLSGTVAQVRVTLNGLSHTFPDDLDILLVGPGGQRTILMSDAGGDPDLSNINLTFDQSAPTLPDAGPITAGSYRPANYGGNTTIEPNGVDNFPAPAPGQTNYTADLTVFNGTSPNGTWQLYVVDDENVDTGSINSGWSLDITTGGGTSGWLTVTSGASGSGSGTVGYTVAANTGANSRSGTIAVGGQTHTVTQAGTTSVTARRQFDFDGDGKADVSVFRPDNGAWYLQQSAAGFTGITFGFGTDKLVPADFDGDGKTDVAVYRNGTWYIQRSSLGFTGVAFGDSNDIPVPADFDGDGKADIAVFRPSNGTWYLLQSTAGFTGVAFGIASDKPVPADYDGDGKADIAVNRSGTWYIQRSQLGFYGIQFGDGNDKLVPADYDGDGKADVAVFRPSNGVWYLQQSTAGFTGIAFGLGTDIPTPADYDGDGKADIAVFRNGTWYLQRSTNGFFGIAFGASTDRPIPNVFVK